MGLLDKAKKLASKQNVDKAKDVVGENVDKAKDLVGKNADKITETVGKVTDKIDEKTEGKYHDKLAKVDETVEKTLEKTKRDGDDTDESGPSTGTS
jgi:uncharacterized protein YjbJ (UPF0337 family)